MDWLNHYRELALFFWPSIVCGLGTAIAGATLGVFVLLRREALLALALPQVVAMGAAIGLRFLAAIVLSATAENWLIYLGWPTLPPAIVAVVIALIVLSRVRRGRHHLLLPCLYVGALCASFLLISGSGQHLIELQNIFTGIDVAADEHLAEVTAPLLGLIGLTTAILWRRWLLIAQAPAAAQLAGLRVARWDALFLTLLSAAVLLSTNALGVVMVLSMLFLPAAAVLPFTRRIPAALAFSVALAIGMYAVGFVVSNDMNWPLTQSVGGVGFAAVIVSHVLAAIFA